MPPECHEVTCTNSFHFRIFAFCRIMLFHIMAVKIEANELKPLVVATDYSSLNVTLQHTVDGKVMLTVCTNRGLKYPGGECLFRAHALVSRSR